jgi:hypothetical protein
MAASPFFLPSGVLNPDFAPSFLGESVSSLSFVFNPEEFDIQLLF